MDWKGGSKMTLMDASKAMPLRHMARGEKCEGGMLED